MKKDNSDEFREILQEKNNLIIKQTRRIELLEDKLIALRRKYFRLKGTLHMIR